MFKLINKEKEQQIRKHNTISFIIKKDWMPITLVSHSMIPYNVYLFSNDTTNNLHLYTCYMDIQKNILKISNLTYTKKSKSILHLKYDLAYLYLTMTIEQAIKLAETKHKKVLIFSSYIINSLEILLDYNFKHLDSDIGNNFQIGTKVLVHKKEIHENNKI